MKMLLGYYSGQDNGKDEIVVADVGVDSYITYRRTVSSSSDAYHYTIELASSNNTRIAGADNVMHSDKIDVLTMPAPQVCVTNIFGLYPAGMGGDICSGAVDVGRGQQFHYVLAGSNIMMLVLNITNFQAIEDTGHFDSQYGFE